MPWWLCCYEASAFGPSPNPASREHDRHRSRAEDDDNYCSSAAKDCDYHEDCLHDLLPIEHDFDVL